MAGNQPYQAGRHFLQIPGPTNVPDRILRAIDGATIDHRGPGFERLALRVRRTQERQDARVSPGRAGSEAGIDPAAWNWQYTVAGDTTQAPVNVFDDGAHTYLQFDPKTRVPAIFLVHPDETESLVNVVRRGRFLVVHDVGRQFTLRNGAIETCLFNEAWNPAPGRTLNSPPEDPEYEPGLL